MKIRRVSIQSYGGVTGFYADFSGHNMVLVYGDNEAGKSTVTEFIRTTLFPTRATRYPVPKKSDGGSMEIVMDDGDIRILQRDQRKVVERDGKQLPPDELHLDADTYRSLFALDLDQLTNDKIITSGDLKRRFLTVPGGEHVPSVSKSIRAEMDSLMNKERLTDAKIIGKYRKEVRRLDGEIFAREEAIDEYSTMVTRLENLNEQLAYLHDMQDTANYVRNKQFMLKSLRDNMKQIEKLKKERQDLEYSEGLTDEDIIRYDGLRSKIATLDNLLDDIDPHDADSGGQMSAARVSEIMSKEDEIENVWGLKTRLDILTNTLEDLHRAEKEDESTIRELCEELGITEDKVSLMKSDPKAYAVLVNPQGRKTVSSKVNKFISRRNRVMCTIISAFGFGAGAYLQSYPLMMVSTVFALFVNVLPSVIEMFFQTDQIDWNTWFPEHGFPAGISKEVATDMMLKADIIHDRIRKRDLSRERIVRFEEEMEAIKQSVNVVLKDLGIDTGNVFGDLNEMYGQYRIAKNISESFSESDGLVDKKLQTEREYAAILERYGGEDNIKKMRSDREKLRTIDIKLDALVKSVESATSVAEDMSSKDRKSSSSLSVQESEESIKEKIDSINQEIGHVTAEMTSIMGDTDIDDLRYQRSVQNGKMIEASKRWAVLSLADTIINECCVRFYSSLQPSVIKTANMYLSMMTGGRYQIVTDPRDSELTIEDRAGKKTVESWSSGLGDQVYLAVKMAVAKEMTDETVPFIMDDVLVRFDRDRKQGACRAIMDFARDRQVIMFTCDRYLESAFRLEGEIKYIEL